VLEDFKLRLRSSLLLGGLLLLGSNKLAGLLDSHAEVLVVLQDVVQLWDLQIDQHTSDLWCLVTLQLRDEFENCGTNLVLVVWVFFDDGLHHRNAALQVSVFDRQDWLLLLLLREAWHHVLLNRHLLNRLHLSLHIHVILRDLAHRSAHVVGAGLRATVAVLAIPTLVLEILALLALVLHRVGSTVGSWCGLVVHVWHLGEEFLEHVKKNLLFHAHSRLLEALRLTESHEVNLVLVFYVLKLAYFLDLVVIDLESAALELDALELRDSFGGVVWSMEADEAVWVLALFLREESHTFNFTKLAKEVTDVLLSASFGDVFDEEIAFFL